MKRSFANMQAQILSPITPASQYKQTLRRLASELSDILRNPIEGIDALPIDGNLFNWTGTIFGPEGTPYSGGKFELNIQFPKNYPLKPPVIKFATKVYHPNVDSWSGHVSLSVLGDEWTPALTIGKLVLSIQAFLGSPDTEDAIMPEIASEFARDKELYEKTARDWTRNYASGDGAIESTLEE